MEGGGVEGGGAPTCPWTSQVRLDFRAAMARLRAMARPREGPRRGAAVSL